MSPERAACSGLLALSLSLSLSSCTPDSAGPATASSEEGEGESAATPDPAPEDDEGVDAEGPADDPAASTAVELPRLPDWDCPEGAQPWTVGEGESWEHSVCRPAPTVDCPRGFMQRYGDEQCVRVGTACPDSKPSDADVRALAPGFDGAVLRVSRPGPGLGSAFRSLAEAVASSPASGSIIFIGPGLWSEQVVISQRLAIVGSCPEDVILQGPAADSGQSTIHFVGAGGGRVANLSFGGVNGVDVAVRLEGGAPSEVEDVLISGARRAGVFFMGGGSGGVVRNVRIDDSLGQAVGVAECQAVHVDGLQANNLGGAGVLIFNADDAEERGVRVENVRVTGVGTHGIQFSECNGSSLKRAYVSGANIDAVVAIRRKPHPAGEVSVDIEDLYVFDPVDHDAEPLRALEVYGSQEVHARRVVAVGPKQYVHLALTGGDGELVIDYDQFYVVDASPPLAVDGTGYGMALMGNVRGRVSRILIERAESVGLASSTWRGDRFPEVTAQDVVVADTQSPNGLEAGYGLMAFDGTTMHLERVLLVGNRDIALVVWGWGRSPETRVTATDITVRDTEPASCDAMAFPPPRCEVREDLDRGGGNGLIAGQGGRLTVDRFDVRSSSKSGVVVGDGGLLRGQGGVIARNAIGINLLDDEYDVSALKDVRFEENATNVGQQQIRLPDPGALLEEVRVE